MASGFATPWCRYGSQQQRGIDIVTDGEQSKPSFNAYLIERLTGFEAVASSEERIAARMKTDEARAFPNTTKNHFAEHMCSVGPNLAGGVHRPHHYKGQAAVRTDIENLKARSQRPVPARFSCRGHRPGLFHGGFNTYFRLPGQRVSSKRWLRRAV